MIDSPIVKLSRLNSNMCAVLLTTRNRPPARFHRDVPAREPTVHSRPPTVINTQNPPSTGAPSGTPIKNSAPHANAASPGATERPMIVPAAVTVSRADIQDSPTPSILG